MNTLFNCRFIELVCSNDIQTISEQELHNIFSEFETSLVEFSDSYISYHESYRTLTRLHNILLTHQINTGIVEKKCQVHNDSTTVYFCC